MIKQYENGFTKKPKVALKKGGPKQNQRWPKDDPPVSHLRGSRRHADGLGALQAQRVHMN